MQETTIQINSKVNVHFILIKLLNATLNFTITFLNESYHIVRKCDT